MAVCNLASIAVNQFVDTSTKTYDFARLKEIAKVATKNLNKIIDVNYYPIPEAKKSNMRHRPIGIGIQVRLFDDHCCFWPRFNPDFLQGLADAFILMRFPFESDEAIKLNQQIFETIYYGAMESSCEIAEKEGTYETYPGSPLSKGIFQFDMWDKTPTDLHDWAELKAKVAKHGARNSLLLAPMPTASTAQVFLDYALTCLSVAELNLRADPRQQRRHRGVHEQHLHQAGALRRVPGTTLSNPHV